MAKNLNFLAEAYTIDAAATHPATPASGSPCVFGRLPGVSLTAERADGKTTIQFRGTFTVSAQGVGNSGNSAIVAGDQLYYDINAGSDPVINKKTQSGSPLVATVPFGIALEGVGSGQTAAIKVLLTSGA